MFDFISEKTKSKYNLGWIFGPIMAAVLVSLGEFIGTGITQFISSPFPTSPRIRLIFDLFSFLFITLTVLFWARKIEKSPWKGIGFAKKNAWRDFLLGWFFGGAFLTACVVVMMLFGGVQITGFNLTLTVFLQFLPLLLVWSIQGHAEEVLTRGWLFTSVAAKHTIPIGIAISSIVFALLHLANDGVSIIPMLDLVLFGILGALYYLKTGSIWGISGAHAAWNCFQGNVFGFRVSGTDVGTAFIDIKQAGPEWLSGGPFGVEGSIVSVIAQALVIAWLIYDLFLKDKSAANMALSKTI